jgi:hypothetical protein
MLQADSACDRPILFQGLTAAWWLLFCVFQQEHTSQFLINEVVAASGIGHVCLPSKVYKFRIDKHKYRDILP